MKQIKLTQGKVALVDKVLRKRSNQKKEVIL
jgi:hypothetical protein